MRRLTLSYDFLKWSPISNEPLSPQKYHRNMFETAVFGGAFTGSPHNLYVLSARHPEVKPVVYASNSAGMRGMPNRKPNNAAAFIEGLRLAVAGHTGGNRQSTPIALDYLEDI